MTSSAFFSKGERFIAAETRTETDATRGRIQLSYACCRYDRSGTFVVERSWRHLQLQLDWGHFGYKIHGCKKMIAAVKTYLPNSFVANYHRFFQDGWLKRAFVSYFSGPLEGSESQAIEILIDSVHRFSVYPIVVLHGGMATPLHWSPEVFPRLILLSMAELPSVVGLDTTLLAAAVISHVQTGILLSHYAVVFPGIDHFFAATEREVNESYPYPILPVRLAIRRTCIKKHIGSIFAIKHHGSATNPCIGVNLTMEVCSGPRILFPSLAVCYVHCCVMKPIQQRHPMLLYGFGEQWR